MDREVPSEIAQAISAPFLIWPSRRRRESSGTMRSARVRPCPGLHRPPVQGFTITCFGAGHGHEGISGMSKLNYREVFFWVSRWPCVWASGRAEAGQPVSRGGPPGDPGAGGPAGSYNGPGDTVPQRGGPNGTQPVAHARSRARRTSSRTPATSPASRSSVRHGGLWQQDVLRSASPSPSSTTAPIPTRFATPIGWDRRRGDQQPEPLDSNGTTHLHLPECGARSVRDGELHQRPRHRAQWRLCAGECRPSEAGVWIQYISGNLCGAFKLHEGNLLLPHRLSALRLRGRPHRLQLRLHDLCDPVAGGHSPGTLSANRSSSTSASWGLQPLLGRRREAEGS